MGLFDRPDWDKWYDLEEDYEDNSKKSSNSNEPGCYGGFIKIFVGFALFIIILEVLSWA